MCSPKLKDNSMSKIIDFHSHYIPSEIAKYTSFYKVGWSDLDKQLKAMDENGIEKTLLLYPTSDAQDNMPRGDPQLVNIYNDKIIEITKKYPDRFIGAGILPILIPEGNIIRILKKLQDAGINCLSMASSYYGRFLEYEAFDYILSFLNDNEFIIHVHSQTSDPIGEDRVKDPLLSPVLEYVFDVSMCIGRLMMEGTFDKYDKIKWIFAHYGGVLPFVKDRFDSIYSMLRSRNFVKDLGQLPTEFFNKLYFDTSGSQSIANLLCALEMVSPEQILFGSDYPANKNIKESINAVNDAPIDESKKKIILSNNPFERLQQ